VRVRAPWHGLLPLLCATRRRDARPRREQQNGRPAASGAARYEDIVEDIVGELRKVIWPSWGELRTMTFVVIVTVVVVSIMLGLIDYVLSQTLVKVEFPKLG